MPVRITTLGSLNIHVGERAVEALSTRRLRCAIVAYVAVERRASRLALQELLWPRRDPALARASLARHVRELNRAVGSRVVELRGNEIRLADGVETDVGEFERAVPAGDRESALAGYGGSFLEGFDPPTPAFDGWMRAQRTRLAALRDSVAAGRIPEQLPAPGDPPEPDGRPSIVRAFSELQRRRVFRVGAAYATVAFVFIQGVPPVFEALGVPAWATSLVIVMLVAGFPFALVLSWAFELTPDGRLRLERPSPAAPIPAWGGRSPGRLIAAAVLVPVMAGALYFTSDRLPVLWRDGNGSIALGPHRYAVLPLQREVGSDSAGGEDALLAEALAGWSGIEVIDPREVANMLGSRPRVLTPAEEVRVAHSLGAGHYLRGRMARVGESVRLHVAVHNGRDGSLLADTVVQYAVSATDLPAVHERIIRTALFRAAGVAPPGDAGPASRSFPAVVAFQRGQDAVAAWNLGAADSLFGAALDHDPELTAAALWRAQVLNWGGTAPSALRALAERAVANEERLLPRERRLASALLDLARDSFVSACASYDRLLADNERDFAGWFGRGECHARDQVVVPDLASPSGWAFRSSYHQAAEAYYRAFMLMGALNRDVNTPMAARARTLLHTGSTFVRAGWPADRAGVFLAQPELVADTLQFLPYPVGDPRLGRNKSGAIERQRRRFHEVAAGWARAFPASADAQESLAMAQELLGDAGALATLSLARSLASDGPRQARLAAMEVLLRAKFGTPDRPAELERARALADSVLTVHAQDLGSRLDLLATCAALTGRVHAAARHARAAAQPEQWRIPLPLTVKSPAEALLTYAAFGGPADSIAAYEQQLVAAVTNRLPREDQQAALNHLADLAASLAFAGQPLASMGRLAETTGYPFLRAQYLSSRGDREGALAVLAGHVTAAQDVRPAERSFDALFIEATLLASLGDGVRARSLLDSTLTAIRWTEPGSLNSPYRAATLVHAMALHAELAAAQGDVRLAGRWAAPVATLWRDADDELQPLVVRMRELAARAGIPGFTTTTPPGGRR